MKECHHDAYKTLESDLNNFVQNDIPLCLGVNLQCLDDGSGIASTLLKNQAKYHNGCRSHFCPLVVQCELDRRTREILDEEEETVSPKKTRSSFNASLDREIYNVSAVKSSKMMMVKKYTKLGVSIVERTFTNGQQSPKTG